jgi:membrane protease YdiL (CAAX protease family)
MFFGTLIIYGVQILASLIVAKIPAINNNADLYFLCNMLPTYIIAYPAIFLMFKLMPVQISQEKKYMKVSHILVAFLICYAGTYLTNIVGNIITTIIGAIKQGEVGNVMLDLTSQISPWVNFLIVVIAAPVMEELLFRKFIIDRITRYGEGVAIVVSGLMFGLFHGNLNQFVYAFLIGVFFGFIYVKTRQIKYTIILHMIINFLGGFVSSALLKFSNYFELMNLMSGDINTEVLMEFMKDNALGLLAFMAYSMLLTGCVVAGIVLFFINKRKFRLEAGEVVIEKGQRFKTIILNLGMILFVIFWLASIVRQLYI